MEKKSKNPLKKPLPNYVKYTNIAIQMAAIITLGVFGGLQLDKLVQWRVPLFTLILSLLSVGLAIYLAIKDFIKMGKK